ncbi:peptidoglycan D,D-transpeptidase FtsI family protein [Clostridium cellulovorans]|uniref:Penicillin-binding protein transpeptidase n=1 Tax=Clostridium cellulovorans (strain ATCC 35296 / DSM 3052 / OCM 3 / 743B) TaxID=573061 RepID=D9SQ84_CLOC7|nr:penicillin-binding transpeptidase domain-containing protein [Clostridium cellulovorans]ADL50151.1 penicillin-binding protein transpeptidase [Clostridium cellulovorans 743B]
MKDITNNVKKVMIVYLIIFISLISYITYFILFTGPKIEDRSDNQRLWAQRNEVLRGTIYDKNMTPLSQSTRNSEGNQVRTYNGGAYTAHALGFEDARYGITGLENKYDSYLMKDNHSKIIDSILSGEKRKEKIGESVVTTLDINLQKKAYEALGNNKGSIVVLDVKTGGILAMVSKPSYDPNDLEAQWEGLQSSENRPLLNRSVSGLYPPGSTFKVITSLSAIENLQGITEEIFNDDGALEIGGGYSLKNDSGEVLGKINLEEALAYSSNVVFGDIGIRLGNKKLRDTAEALYFNNDTPADGIVIDNSIFPKYSDNEEGNIAQSAIGQAGVLASPIQMALVAATIAHGGEMMEPHMVSRIIDKDSKLVEEIKPKSLGQKVPTNAANLVRSYMRSVVTGGTGVNVSSKNVQVAGKTGTADNETGSPHSWFIGFAPYDNPEIAIAVVAEGAGYGAQVAVPAASKVINQYFSK